MLISAVFRVLMSRTPELLGLWQEKLRLSLMSLFRWETGKMKSAGAPSHSAEQSSDGLPEVLLAECF
jgi:hypothetical protein